LKRKKRLKLKWN